MFILEKTAAWFFSTMIVSMFFWDFKLKFQRAVNRIYISSRFTLVNHKLKFLLSYFVKEILGNNFESLVLSTICIKKYTITPLWGIVEQNGLKNEFLMVVFSKIYHFEGNQNFSTTSPWILTEKMTCWKVRSYNFDNIDEIIKSIHFTLSIFLENSYLNLTFEVLVRKTLITQLI